MSDIDQISTAIRQGINGGIQNIGDQLVIAFQRFTDGLYQLKAQLTRIEGKLTNMSAELDKLTTDVAHTTDVEESAITLLQGLSGQIAAMKNDPVALTALSNSLNTEADKLAAAVVANTPAAPPGPTGP